MPQRKKRQVFYGIHNALLYHPEVIKFAAKRPGMFRVKEEFLVLVKAAAQPRYFTNFRSPSDFISSFGQIYTRQPDDVLDFMRLIRRIFAKWDKTQAGKVILFCFSHRSAIVESRREDLDEKGNRIAIIVKSNLDGTEKRIPVSNLPPEKIQELLIPKIRDKDSLLDKELATLLSVNPDSVKKARQVISRLEKQMEFWENPEVVNFIKTGIMTLGCKRLVLARGKAKK